MPQALCTRTQPPPILGPLVAALLALLCLPPSTIAQDPTGEIPSLRATVVSLRFFEGPVTPTPREQRVYRDAFDGSTTRYVYWELNLEHPAPGRRTPFTIEAFWYAGDTRLRRHAVRYHVQADWTWSFWHHGFNFAAGGAWPVGVYRVEVFVEGAKIASDWFQIYDAHCRGDVTVPEADKVEPYERLAAHARSQGDEAHARKAREQLATAYAARAGMCVLNGNLEAAQAEYTKALALVPDDLWYRNRGRARFEAGDLRGALADYTEAIRLNPKDGEYFDSRGVARFRLGELAEARGDLDEAIRLRPKVGEFYEHRGVVRAHLRDPEGAIQDLQHAASLYGPRQRAAAERAQGAIAAVQRQAYAALTIRPEKRDVRS